MKDVPALQPIDVSQMSELLLEYAFDDLWPVLMVMIYVSGFLAWSYDLKYRSDQNVTAKKSK